MRRGLIDSLKFSVAESDYRYDRIKNREVGVGVLKQGIWGREMMKKKKIKEKRR